MSYSDLVDRIEGLEVKIAALDDKFTQLAKLINQFATNEFNIAQAERRAHELANRPLS